MGVPTNFRAGLWGIDVGDVRGAPMSMVHVENCALAHVLAACQLGRPDVNGRAFFVADFDENIVNCYRTMGGRGACFACLPYWLLSLLVHVSMIVHLLLLALTFGAYNFLDGKMGLHHGAYVRTYARK